MDSPMLRLARIVREVIPCPPLIAEAVASTVLADLDQLIRDLEAAPPPARTITLEQFEELVLELRHAASAAPDWVAKRIVRMLNLTVEDA